MWPTRIISLNRTVFWLDDLNASELSTFNDIKGVTSSAHLRAHSRFLSGHKAVDLGTTGHEIESQYWCDALVRCYISYCPIIPV